LSAFYYHDPIPDPIPLVVVIGIVIIGIVIIAPTSNTITGIDIFVA
jgi:hypothetical protein